MPELNIEDFSVKDTYVEEEKKQKERNNEKSSHDIEELYRKKIEEIKQFYEKKIEEEKKQAFEQGYSKAKEEIEKNYKDKINSILENALREKEIELKNEFKEKEKTFIDIVNKLKEKYEKHFNFIDELILSALEEILEYLYIDKRNTEYLAREIRKIIIQAKDESRIKIRIHPAIKEKIEELDIPSVVLECDESMKEGDFLIEFDYVQFESNFKEKVKILKDEIKREIKKNT